MIAYLSKPCYTYIDYMDVFLWEHELKVGTIISLYY